jgi:hypothetical protein
MFEAQVQEQRGVVVLKPIVSGTSPGMASISVFRLKKKNDYERSVTLCLSPPIHDVGYFYE